MGDTRGVLSFCSARDVAAAAEVWERAAPSQRSFGSEATSCLVEAGRSRNLIRGVRVGHGRRSQAGSGRGPSDEPLHGGDPVCELALEREGAAGGRKPTFRIHAAEPDAGGRTTAHRCLARLHGHAQRKGCFHPGPEVAPRSGSGPKGREWRWQRGDNDRHLRPAGARLQLSGVRR